MIKGPSDMGDTTERRRCKKRPAAIVKRKPKNVAISSQDIYSLEFDGASKGNPGKAGAGAILKAPDGSVVCQLTKGVGIATCNFAEYQALIIGLKAALDRGVCHIKAQGDSQLVCMQMMGLYKVRSPNILQSFSEAMKLKKKFESFSVQHVHRELNSAADSLANDAVTLPDDQPQCQCDIARDGKENPVKHQGILDFSASVCSPQRKEEIYRINYHGAVNGKYAGAGVVLYSPDGTLHSKINQELGAATRNVAHYQAFLIGLQTALQYKASHIQIQGDSVLVFKQMTGVIKVNEERLQTLWKEANALLGSFSEFSILHVDKSQNSVACTLAETASRSPNDRIKSDNAKSVSTSDTAHMCNVHGGDSGDSQKIQMQDTSETDLRMTGMPVEISTQSLPKAALLFQAPTRSSALFGSHSHQLNRVPSIQAPQPLPKCLPLCMVKTSHRNVLQCRSRTARIIPCIFRSSFMHIHSAGALCRQAFCSSVLQMCLKRSL